MPTIWRRLTQGFQPVLQRPPQKPHPHSQHQVLLVKDMVQVRSSLCLLWYTVRKLGPTATFSCVEVLVLWCSIHAPESDWSMAAAVYWDLTVSWTCFAAWLGAVRDACCQSGLYQSQFLQCCNFGSLLSAPCTAFTRCCRGCWSSTC